MSDVAPEVAAGNAESTEAWSGPLFERFLRFRDPMTAGLGAHGEVALAAHPPAPGDRALDIGCGFGDTTRRLAELVGDGEVVGVDVAEPFLEVAREEAAAAGVDNVDFRVGDVQVADLGGPYDYVFSRMGVMFFANPVAALRNVRAAMRPGARFCVVVWRRKLDNSWVWEAEQVVEKYLDHPEESDEPTCGPGPFSMANADTVTDQLAIAGFESIELLRSDLPLRMGMTLARRGGADDGARAGGGGVAAVGRPGGGDPADDRGRDPRGAGAVRDGGRGSRAVVDLGDSGVA